MRDDPPADEPNQAELPIDHPTPATSMDLPATSPFAGDSSTGPSTATPTPRRSTRIRRRPGRYKDFICDGEEL